MTYTEIYTRAKQMIDDFNCDGFVIIQNPIEKINQWKKYGYDVTYDYIIFDDFESLQTYVNGGLTFDYMDESTKKHDEKIVTAFSKTKIIIFGNK